MQIGIPAEVRAGETRVAATPETVKKLTAAGHHKVLIQTGAGNSASVPDAEFIAAGASIVSSVTDIFQASEIVLKVRPPEASELGLIRKDTILVGLLNDLFLLPAMILVFKLKFQGQDVSELSPVEAVHR